MNLYYCTEFSLTDWYCVCNARVLWNLKENNHFQLKRKRKDVFSTYWFYLGGIALLLLCTFAPFEMWFTVVTNFLQLEYQSPSDLDLMTMNRQIYFLFFDCFCDVILRFTQQSSSILFYFIFSNSELFQIWELVFSYFTTCWDIILLVKLWYSLQKKFLFIFFFWNFGNSFNCC